MDEMSQQLGAILNNPQMMQQIMAMAQTLGQNNPPPPEPPRPDPPKPAAPPLQNTIDPVLLQRIFQIVQRSGIDKDQQNLLRALGPYLPRERIIKLEKAMRAAKIAGLAGTALSSSGISFFSGR